jgi:transcriptional regulator with XRE-family HTH domain
MDAKELGRQVLARRKERELSQDELGKLANISRNYVSLIERGEANSISMKVINQLAIVLGTSPAELTGETTAQSMVMIPPALRELGLQNNLSYETIDRLARIPRRGREPKTVKEWQELYQTISQYIEGEEKE